MNVNHIYSGTTSINFWELLPDAEVRKWHLAVDNHNNESIPLKSKTDVSESSAIVTAEYNVCSVNRDLRSNQK